jgi:hypothetical protein
MPKVRFSSPRLDQRVLHQIFGISERAQHAVAMRAQLAAVPFGELTERRLITPSHGLDHGNVFARALSFVLQVHRFPFRSAAAKTVEGIGNHRDQDHFS